MAVVYLDSDDAVTVYGPGTVYGGTGRERVLLADGARNVTLSPTVEEMHLSRNAAGYQFRGASGRVEVWLDGAMVAAMPATSGGQEARFADGAADLSVDPVTGAVLLGGRVLGSEPVPIPDLPLDASRPSGGEALNPDPSPDPDPSPSPNPGPAPGPSRPSAPDTPGPDSPSEPSRPSEPESRDEIITSYPWGATSVVGTPGWNTFFSFPEAGALKGMAVVDPDGFQGRGLTWEKSPYDNLLFSWTADSGLPSRIVGVESVEAVWKGDSTYARFDMGSVSFEDSGCITLGSERPDTTIVVDNAGAEYAMGANVSRLMLQDGSAIVYTSHGGVVRLGNMTGVVYGSTGTERVLVDDFCRNVQVSPAVEELHFARSILDYEFSTSGSSLEVRLDGLLLARVTVALGQMLFFADGAARASVSAETGAAILGGQELSTMPLPGSEIPLDRDRVSGPWMPWDGPSGPDPAPDDPVEVISDYAWGATSVVGTAGMSTEFYFPEAGVLDGMSVIDPDGFQNGWPWDPHDRLKFAWTENGGLPSRIVGVEDITATWKGAGTDARFDAGRISLEDSGSVYLTAAHPGAVVTLANATAGQEFQMGYNVSRLIAEDGSGCRIWAAKNGTVHARNLSDASLLGGFGLERVLIENSCENVSISSNVESIHFARGARNYAFVVDGGDLLVRGLNAAVVARISAAEQGQTLFFADGAVSLARDADTGAISLGGQTLTTTPTFYHGELDAGRISEIAGPTQKGSSITASLAYGDTFDASNGAFGIDLSQLAESYRDLEITIRNLGRDDTLIFSRQMLEFGLRVDREVNNGSTGYGDAFVPDGCIDIVTGTGGQGALTIHLIDVDFALETLTTMATYEGLNRGFHDSGDLDGGTNADRALTVQVRGSDGSIRNYEHDGFPGITWDSDVFYPHPEPIPEPEPLSVQKGANITNALAYGATFDASTGAWGIDLSGLAASSTDQTITIRGFGKDDTLIFGRQMLDRGLSVDRAVTNGSWGSGDAFSPDGNIDIVVGAGGQGALTIHLIDVDFTLETLVDQGNYMGLNCGFHDGNDLSGGTNVNRALTVQVMGSGGPENYDPITWDSGW